jgi:2,3-bisphosphoglycerate-dependent phosphoglycerate mutase
MWRCQSNRFRASLLQFGLFAGVPWADLETMYPPEVEYYKRSAAFGGKFWAKMPLGESR